MKKKIGTLLILGMLLAPVAVFADSGGNGIVNPGSGGNGIVNPGSGGNGFALKNPLNVGSFCGLLLKLLDAIIAFGVPIAFLFLVYSGFLFITARGSEEKLNHAKRNFFYVIVGIGLFLGAWTFGQIVAATVKDLGGPNTQSCQ